MGSHRAPRLSRRALLAEVARLEGDLDHQAVRDSSLIDRLRDQVAALETAARLSDADRRDAARWRASRDETSADTTPGAPLPQPRAGRYTVPAPNRHASTVPSALPRSERTTWWADTRETRLADTRDLPAVVPLTDVPHDQLATHWHGKETT